MPRQVFRVLAALLLFAGAAAAEQKPLTVDDYLKLQYARSPAVSPDGGAVAFVVRDADFERNRFVNSIWLVTADGSRLSRFTESVGSDWHPRWSPDGTRLAFLSTRPYVTPRGERKEGKAQIWLIPRDGGEAIRLTDAVKGVSDFAWLPDSHGLLYLTRETLPPEERQKREELRKKGFDAIVVDERRYSQELWRLDLTRNRGDKVATLDPGVNGIDVRPDGRWLVYATNYTGEYNDEQRYDLWLVNLETGEKRQFTDFAGPETQPRFSPDGSRIAYVAQTVPDIEFAETDIWVIPFEGGEPVNLTEKFGYAASSPVWARDGKSVYFLAAVRTATHVMRVSLADRQVKSVAGGDANFAGLTCAKRSGALVATRETATTLPEVVFIRGKEKVYRVTDFSKQLSEFSLGQQAAVRWKSDNWQIEGILIYPVGYQKGQRVPLILTVHGGPYGRFRNTFRQAYMSQVYAGQGYAVLGPNPRGSAGYSDAFGQANRYDLGGGDYRDIMAGVDHVIELGVVDSSRMGVIGGSYGGFMTNWIISHTQRFKAAVSMFGIFSLFTDWSNSVQPDWEKMYFGKYYWEDMKPYIEHSPAFYVQNIHTPVLILHGEEDELTFIANSKEMYQALKVLGRPVKFVIYPREGHGISREPNHIRDRMRRTLDWFAKYVKGQK